MIDLTGKVAVIFGLANKRSIAWAIAQKLSEAGAKVIGLTVFYSEAEQNPGLVVLKQVKTLLEPLAAVAAIFARHRRSARNALDTEDDRLRRAVGESHVERLIHAEPAVEPGSVATMVADGAGWARASICSARAAASAIRRARAKLAILPIYGRNG